jgi:hypothetical protein
MSKLADITMSLDGYVTGPSGDVDQLHAWVAEQDPVDTEILQQATAATGAVVMGRRLFDVVDGPNGWDQGHGVRRATGGDAAVLGRYPRAAAAGPAGTGAGGTWRCCRVAEPRRFGRGTRQRYHQRDVRASRNAVHLTYERLISAEQ